MITRRVPGTQIDVSILCLGTMTFGTPVDAKGAQTLVHAARDVGVTFFDTANMYEGYTRTMGSAGGVGEQFLGEALVGWPEAIVATKVGNAVGPTAADTGLHREHVRRECERSLGRLQRESIDFFYAHRPDPDTPLVETVEIFVGLIDEGLVRHWGLSNFDAEQTQAVLDVCDSVGAPRPVLQQPAFSLLDHRIERDLLPLCRGENIGVVPYRVLEGGLLTGKYVPHHPPPVGSRGSEMSSWIPRLDDAETQAMLLTLKADATSLGRTLLEHTLCETAQVDGLTSLVLGATKAEQVLAAAAALDTLS
ncbi:MAG: aldo/keto reductase [Candidatus Latescibacteria bacterium]|jgi:aryl-alcohol dehydrogenase-like predicted oxidoreductase|nr:aldo/keto reductase [Candidatus Latescibacterota bacterium]MEE3042190.1 aldo/keto reductase [Candidatus Latescibacterota bacterium]